MDKIQSQKSGDRAKVSLNPTAANAQLIAQVAKLPKVESEAISQEIERLAQEIRSGDNSHLEEMLLAQAASLNAFAADCLMKASGFLTEGMVVKFPELTASLAQMGLKAQDQSRKAILALNELRNPKKPSQFIKNYVHQQLNQVQLEQQELKQQLEAATNAPLDIGSATEAGRTDQEVETVGKEHGTRHPERAKSVIPEQLKDRMPHG